MFRKIHFKIIWTNDTRKYLINNYIPQITSQMAFATKFCLSIPQFHSWIQEHKQTEFLLAPV